MTTGERTTDKDTSERWYPYPPTGELLDSVTTLIAGTDSKPWLRGWYGATSMAWAVDNLEAVARTKVLKGRKAAIDLGKDAAEKLRDIKADAGTYVHDVVERLILWAASPGRTGADIALPLLPDHLADALYDGEPLADVVEFMVDGFLAFTADLRPDFEAAEMTVYNQPLGYAGTLDMIVTLKGYALSFGTGPRGEDEVVACPGSALVACVDTKTGRSPEGTWKEQLAAYRRATECLLPMGDVRPMPSTDCAAVLHLRPEYPDGYSLQLVSAAKDEAAWSRFQRACGVYRERQQVKGKPGTAIRPLRADGTMPGPRLCDLAAEGYGRALAPLRKALGDTCEIADVAKFSEPEIRAVKGIGPALITVIRQMLADHRLSLAGEATTAKGEAA